MPLGSHHELTGLLDLDRHGILLRLDGGGHWRLDAGIFASWTARRLLGRRVEVRGTRDGFNVLAVSAIEAAEW